MVDVRDVHTKEVLGQLNVREDDLPILFGCGTAAM
jgi:hypothetical protein